MAFYHSFYDSNFHSLLIMNVYTLQFAITMSVTKQTKLLIVPFHWKLKIWIFLYVPGESSWFANPVRSYVSYLDVNHKTKDDRKMGKKNGQKYGSRNAREWNYWYNTITRLPLPAIWTLNASYPTLYSILPSVNTWKRVNATASQPQTAKSNATFSFHSLIRHWKNVIARNPSHSNKFDGFLIVRSYREMTLILPNYHRITVARSLVYPSVCASWKVESTKR